MECVDLFIVICPKCSKRHKPPPSWEHGWDWNRYAKCAGCSIILFCGWDDTKNRYYCEILEGENPYDESILEWQAGNDRLQAERKEQSRQETKRQFEAMRQRRVGIKAFQTIKGGVES